METEGLKATEAECAEGRTAPRVSLADIEANIAETWYATGLQIAAAGGGTSRYASMDTLTVCTMVLQNGFVVIGQSAPASPENFDPILGRKLAYENAIRQVWPLMGYALRERLASEPVNLAPSGPDPDWRKQEARGQALRLAIERRLQGEGCREGGEGIRSLPVGIE